MRHLIQGLGRAIRGNGGERRPRQRRRALERLEERHLLAVAAQVSAFLQTNLAADRAGVARVQDPDLVNPWGIALSPAGNFWVADNGTGVSTLYNGDVDGNPATFMKTALTVAIPGGSPTGVVYNATPDFVVHSGTTRGKALFLFASEGGRITGWNPGVPASAMGSTTAQVAATVPGAVFKGLAIGNNGTANVLYAADFHDGTIVVFDKNFAVIHPRGSFVDPNLPGGYAPFDVQDLGGKLYVTYAQQDAAKHDDVPGAGHGFIDVFDTDGTFVQRLASGGPLNSPWGLAIAPANFGTFSNDLLVGNFGDGRINAYDPGTGVYRGQLKDESGNPIAIDGLWGIAFGNGLSAGQANALYFAAGSDHERHGLFGSLTVNPLAAQGVTIQSDRGVALNGVVATFTATNPAAKAADFTTSINWGDGTAATSGTVSGSGGVFSVAGTHTYARSGMYTIRVSIHNSAGDIAAAQSSAVVGTPTERFLERAYRDLLGRSIDVAGLSYWTDQLGRGTSRSDVVARIENNSEYRSVVVRSFYATYLHRSPTSAELKRSSLALATGGTVEGLATRLAASPEYYRVRGGRTINGFLTAFYHDTLGRPVDPTGQGYYGKALASGTLSPGQVAQSILRSEEYRRSLVQTYYRRFLHRAVDPSGLATYTGLLKGGERDQQIIASILGSDEYYALRA